MQSFRTVPIESVRLATSGPAVVGWVGYSPNVTPATTAVELVTEAYFLWATS